MLALVLPSVRPVPSLWITLGLLAALLGTTHYWFRQGLWTPVVYPALALLGTFVAITIYRILTEERQRQYTKRAFQQYVSPEVVARIVDNPEALQFGGELRNLTVLFSDIRDFTTFTEKNDPQLVVQMLREYLTEMTAHRDRGGRHARQVHRRRGDGGVRRADRLSRPRRCAAAAPPCAWPPRWSG